MDHRLAVNLQVLDVKRAEVAAILPEATVARWSDDYVTVLDDGFDRMSVSETGKKLSARLSQAVLSVFMEDDKVLELTVWQRGRKQAVRVFDSVSGASKGDPRVFCQSLGLPEEDAVRLETVWARGNAREQLEITGLLLGTPLNCSAQWPPLARASRDTSWVDEWMCYLADRTKGKNQTRTLILQELPGVMLADETNGNSWEGFLHLRPAGSGEDYEQEDIFCHPGPDGKLECLPQLDPRPEVTRPHHAVCTYVPIGEGRVLSLLQEGEADGSVVVEDSAGLLSCPLPLTSEGQGKSCQGAWTMADGGILVWLDELEGDGSQGSLVRYAPNGMPLWNWSPERPCSVQMFSDDLLWFSDEEGFFSIGIQGEEGARIALNPEAHIDRERGCGVRYSMLKQSIPGEVWILENTFGKDITYKGSTILSFDLQGKPFYDASLPAGVRGGFCEVLVSQKQILLYQYDQGIWLLSPLDLSILAGSEDHREYLDATVDGAGRIWLFVAEEVEAYDKDLTILSRHHLRGSLLHHYLDRKGRLCAVTYDEENHIIRVYRLA